MSVSRVSAVQGPNLYLDRNLVVNLIQSAEYRRAHILLREALQNSWDQRSNHDSPVSFNVALRTLSDRQRLGIKEKVFSSNDPRILPNLAEYLARPTAQVLVIADSNTHGLDGPTDTSKPVAEWGNFLKFFYKYGRDDRNLHSADGGAAGVGRTVFTNSSEAQTILVISQVKSTATSGDELRFMGFTSADAAEHLGTQFTGFHWWGNQGSRAETVMPVLNSEAEALLTEIGFEEFIPKQYGTAIIVLGPSENPGSVSQSRSKGSSGSPLINEMIHATLIFAWPHLLDQTIKFNFDVDGTQLNVPSPKDISRLRDYCSVYEAIGTGSFSNVEALRTEPRILGSLGHLDSVDDGVPSDLDLIPANAVALMRQARFVVKYLQIPQRTNGFSTRGVFVTAPGDADHYFRSSEPATHDDWKPEKLGLAPGTANPVRIAIARIKELLAPATSADAGSPSGQTAKKLSRIFGAELTGIGTWGDGMTLETPNRKEPTRPRAGLAARVIEFGQASLLPAPTRGDNRVLYAFNFKLEGTAAEDTVYNVRFAAGIYTSDGKTESSPPLGGSEAFVSHIVFGGIKTQGAQVQIPSANWDGTILVGVDAPVNAAAVCYVKNVQAHEVSVEGKNS